MLYSRDDSGENFSVVKRRGSHIGGSENGGTTVYAKTQISVRYLRCDMSKRQSAN